MSFKKTGLVKILAIIMTASVMTACLATYSTLPASYAQGNASEKNIYELERNLRNAQEEEKKLKNQLKSVQSSAASYEAEITQLDGEIAVLERQCELVGELQAEWEKSKEETKKQISALKEDIDKEYEVFEAMLRVSYEYGNDTYFNIIFGSEDIGDFLSRLEMIDYHFKANENALSSLSGKLSELQAAEEKLDASATAIENYRVQQEELKVQLAERSEYALQRKMEFEADAAKLKSQVDAKTAEMANMQAEILSYYEQQRKNGNTQSYTGGAFMLPLPVGSYRISSEFSSRISPITGKHENHNGLDMAAPGGTPIYAAASGVVIESKYSNSWGNVIQIDHGGGLITLYAHCSYRGVEKGQTVAAGQQIGKVGTTGWSTGNHLHFTVYKNGVAVNPRGYLSGV